MRPNVYSIYADVSDDYLQRSAGRRTMKRTPVKRIAVAASIKAPHVGSSTRRGLSPSWVMEAWASKPRRTRVGIMLFMMAVCKERRCLFGDEESRLAVHDGKGDVLKEGLAGRSTI